MYTYRTKTHATTGVTRQSMAFYYYVSTPMFPPPLPPSPCIRCTAVTGYTG